MCSHAYSRHMRVTRQHVHTTYPRGHACELKLSGSAAMQLEDRHSLAQHRLVKPPQHCTLIYPAYTATCDAWTDHTLRKITLRL